jgi:hypothetical protein
VTLADWLAAWSAALDELEMDVEEAEAVLTGDHMLRETPLRDAWRPPAGLGPLPLDLRPRADAILARQLATAENITRALATNRRQAAVTARIETGGQAAARPSYIDCAM